MNTRALRLPIIGIVFDWWRTVRRLFSGPEWTARLLQLPHRQSDDQHGLILIQIDGLSRRELERAIQAGRMPWCRRLLRRENYALRTMYSGLPSTTPAVQAELFYGRRTAVPSFAFAVRNRGEVVNMLSSDTAAAVEKEVQAGGVGLLADGSAYSNIYTGDAQEPHFCASALGWNGLLRGGNALSLVLALG